MLGDIRIWEKEAPEEVKKSTCKKCLTNSIMCNKFLVSIHGVDRCDGKLTICLFKIKIRLLLISLIGHRIKVVFTVLNPLQSNAYPILRLKMETLALAKVHYMALISSRLTNVNTAMY